MYSTCLYCSRDLGTNDALETLPIGRRIAFDEGTGRLWVVCRGCEKWNLVPFDNRLETIDACERLFRDAKLKFSTDNIGIARLPEGLELVRIGRAERQEFAAWRYGDQFGRRRVRTWATSTALVAAMGVTFVFRHEVGLVPFIGPLLPSSGSHLHNLYRRRRVAAHVGGPHGGVTTRHLVTKSRFSFDEAGKLVIHLNVFDQARSGVAIGLKTRAVQFGGQDVVPTLGKLLPHLNGGGSRKAIRNAVDLMTVDMQPEHLVGYTRPTTGWSFAQTSALASPSLGETKSWSRRWFPEFYTREYEVGPQPPTALDYRLLNIPAPARLALEMLAHETTERTALAGELKLLERQWKEADKLAKIADDLALPEGMEEEVARRREL